MRLHRLELRDFRGVFERRLTLPERGVTVVLGDNETGKSSLLEAFDLLIAFPSDSKHGRLRDVRPVGRDVGTEVTAEFTLGPVRLHYRKRWFAERGTELRVDEPGGLVRSYTGREAHDEAARLFDEHVDETLWRALVVGQENTLALPVPGEVGAVLAALDEAVQGEDRRYVHSTASVPLTEAVEAEYRRYFTARGKPTDDYARAQLAVEQRQTEVVAAEQRAAEVEDDVHRAERLAQDRERFRVRFAEAEVEVERRQAARRDASELITSVERLRDQAALAAERLNTARAEHARRAQLVDEVTHRADAVVAAAATAAETTEALRRADDDLTTRAGALRAAREALAVAREESTRLDAHLSLLRDRAELSDVETQLAAVELARQDEREAGLELQRNPVDDDAAERVDSAHRELLGARAAMEAGSPKMLVRPLGRSGVLVDGVPIADPTELVVEHDTVVAVTDTVEVTVRPGEGAAALRAAFEDALHAEQVVLTELGLPDVGAVRSAARSRADAERRLAGAREILQRRLDGASVESLAARRDLLAVRAEAASDADLPSDAEAVRDLLEQARSAEAAVGGDLDDAEQFELVARKEFESAREAATTSRVRVEQETERHDDARSALDAARADRTDAALDSALAAATSAAEALLAEHAAAVDALAAAGIGALTEQLEQARRIRDELQRHVERDTGDLRQVEGRLEMAGAHGIASTLQRARADLAGAERRFEILDRRARAAARLRTTLEPHREQAHRRYARPLRQRLETLGRLALGPSFGVVLDDDSRVVARDLHGVQVPVESLSTGAREQLATITRLAIAGLTATDGGGVPVILDDALGWSDPARLQAMGELLARAGESGQVLLLTCVPDRYAFVSGAHVVRL